MFDMKSSTVKTSVRIQPSEGTIVSSQLDGDYSDAELSERVEPPSSTLGRERPRLAPGKCGQIKIMPVGPNLWTARARYRDFGGRLHDMSRRAEDPAVARDLLKASMTNLGRERSRFGRVSSDMSIAALCDYFLAALETDPDVSEQTIAGYAGVLRRRVRPVLENRSISSIDIVDAELFVESLKRAGKQGDARVARGLLKRMFDDALRLGALEKNPFDSTKPVKRKKPEPRAATPNQLNALQDAARTWDSANRPGPSAHNVMGDLLGVLIGTGCRIGEALALRWKDVDLESSQPTVTFCGTLVNTSPTSRKPSTKSESGMRTVPIPIFLVDVLAIRQERDINRANPLGAVFYTSGGTYVSPNNVGRTWRKMRKTAADALNENLDWLTPHSIRRTVATRLYESQSLEAASTQLGHSSTSVTRRHYIEQGKSVRPDMTHIMQGMAYEASTLLA